MSRHEEYLKEECGHVECADTRWSRYCTIEAADIDGDAGIVIDKLNELLYNTPEFERGNYFYRADNTQRFFSRTYHQEYFPQELTSVIGYQQRTTISHERLSNPVRQIYHISTEWYISDEDHIDGVYRSDYTIEQYPPSLIMATINEYDLSTRLLTESAERSSTARTDRPMTGYDHQQLHRLLTDIESLEFAEYSDS